MSRICLPSDAISGPFHDPDSLQFHQEPSDINDATERNKVVSVYPHTELLLQMTLDARWCSTLREANCTHHLANRELPIHPSVSAAVHAPEQTSNFVSGGPPQEARQTPSSEQG